MEQLQWLSQQPLDPADSVRSIAQELYEEDAKRERYRFTPVVVARDSSTGVLEEVTFPDRLPPIDILKLFTDWRQKGNEMVRQCPLCVAAGHDKSMDNLRVSQDGSKFCCVYGGPGQVHKAGDIIKALTSGSR